jgi:hypothetical protein
MTLGVSECVHLGNSQNKKNLMTTYGSINRKKKKKEKKDPSHSLIE